MEVRLVKADGGFVATAQVAAPSGRPEMVTWNGRVFRWEYANQYRETAAPVSATVETRR